MANLETLPWHLHARTVLRVHNMLLLVGPPGVGKTAFAHAVSKEMTERGPIVIQGDPELSRDDIYGHTELRGDHTVVVDGPLTRALREGRHVVIEELNLMPHETRAAFLALRGREEVQLPRTYETLPIPPSFRLIATSNQESLRCRTNGMLAQAVMDDFAVIEVPAVDDDVVSSFLSAQFPWTNEERRAEAIERWERFRQVADDDSSSEDIEGKPVLGYRALALYTKLVEDGEMAPEEAERIALVNRYITDKDRHDAAKTLHSARSDRFFDEDVDEEWR